MASTVAHDAPRVEDWARAAHDEADLPPWPQHRLNAALAELGPARPGAADAAEAWPRVITTADFEPVGGPADSASMQDFETAKLERDGSRAGIEAQLLPPPPAAQPTRQMPILTEELPSRPAILDMAHDARLAETDAVGGEIVRLLASVNMALPSVAPPHAPMTAADVDPMDSPPMIIERARAEQEQGLLAGMPRHTQINPVPGLAVGFTLSLVAGAVLYAVLATG